MRPYCTLGPRVRCVCLNRGPSRIIGGDHAPSTTPSTDSPDAAAREPRGGSSAAQDVTFDELVPWKKPVDGEAVLDEMLAVLRRYMSMGDDEMVAVALWIMHAHTHDVWQISPLLIVTAPEKRSGKTTLGHLIKRLVPRGLMAANATSAGLFHVIGEAAPTMIIDEVDTFLANDRELHGIINTGHVRDSAYLLRGTSQGKAKKFTTWAPKCLIGIDAAAVSDTLTDRAVVIELRRKSGATQRARLRQDTLTRALRPLARKAHRWALDQAPTLKKAAPRLPNTLNDRARDNWRGLLAIAKVAGPRWSEMAFNTAEHFGQVAEETPTDSPGVQLLAGIRECFDATDASRMTTADLLASLYGMEDAPWSTWERGRQLSALGLAALLRRYKIRPKQFRSGDATPRGYERQQFDDAFEAYLPTKPKHPKHPKQTEEPL